MVMIVLPLGPHQRGGAMHGAAQPLVGAAAADIGEIGVDVGIGRIGIALEVGRRRHDLAGLAIAALHDLQIKPGLLNLLATRCITDGFGAVPTLSIGGDAGAGGSVIEGQSRSMTRGLERWSSRKPPSKALALND